MLVTTLSYILRGLITFPFVERSQTMEGIRQGGLDIFRKTSLKDHMKILQGAHKDGLKWIKISFT